MRLIPSALLTVGLLAGFPAYGALSPDDECYRLTLPITKTAAEPPGKTENGLPYCTPEEELLVYLPFEKETPEDVQKEHLPGNACDTYAPGKLSYNTFDATLAIAGDGNSSVLLFCQFLDQDKKQWVRWEYLDRPNN